MNPEQLMYSRNESEAITPLPLYALEGIGGSGKSHIGELLKKQLTTEGSSVATPKIAGLGDSPRVERLKAIKEARYAAFKNGTATQKQLQDQQKDKIFRLAMYQQIKEHRSAVQDGNYDLGIVDRTPLTLWVYNQASNPENPYLNEILKEGLELTESLNFAEVILFDVSVTTSYARMLARYATQMDIPTNFILSSCANINADAEATDEILQKTLALLDNKANIRPKRYESWDFIPFEVAERERDLHKDALAMANRKFGLKYTIVNAEPPITEVIRQIRDILKL